MIEDVWGAVSWSLGLALETHDLNVWHMSLRALVVFVLAVGMIRLGSKRFMGQSTALDVMLGIVFGSTVSRAITGTAPFFPALAASLTLVLVHWLFSALAVRSPRFETLVKGHERTLVRDGEIQWQAMHRAHITPHDLEEAFRINGTSLDFGAVKSAHLERNGDISIIFHKHHDEEELA